MEHRTGTRLKLPVSQYCHGFALLSVCAHNVARQLDAVFPNLITPKNLLTVARVASLPCTIMSACIAAYYHSTKSAAGATGYLLIVAFDIVFATVVVPLFGCYYVKNPSPRAALLSILGGIITRITLEFALPKDGQLILPFKDESFLNYGPAASAAYPSFIDVPKNETWDPSVEPCHQDRYKDYTGVDSISSFLMSLLLFTIVQLYENTAGRPLFTFPGSTGYDKETDEQKDETNVMSATGKSALEEDPGFTAEADESSDED